MTLAQFRTYINATFTPNGEGGIDGTELRDALLQVCDRIEAEGSWQPVMCVIADGPRLVLKITSWTGGQGLSPAAPVYLGPTGYVADVGSAVNLRGPQGLQGLPGSGMVTYYSQPADGGTPWRWLPILVLPADANNTMDFGQVLVVLGGWGHEKQTIRLQLGQRGSFWYRYIVDGPDVANCSLEAYVNGDFTITLYAKIDANFKVVGVNVQIQNQLTVYSTLVPISGSAGGTKVFDTAQPATYPALMRQAGETTTLPNLNITETASFTSQGGGYDSGAVLSMVAAALLSAGGDPRALMIGANSSGTAFFRSVSTGTGGLPGFDFVIANTKVASIDSAGRMGIGTVPTAEKLEVGGRVKTQGLVTAGSLPSVAVGAGLGASGTTASMATGSNDMAGRITFTTTSGATSNSVLATITFNTPYAAAPKAILISARNARATDEQNRVFVSAITAGGFTLSSALSPLSQSFVFEFQYVVVA